jgi:hypothetical protein
MKRESVLRLCVLLLVCCAVVPSLASAQSVADKQSVLSQARQSYYNLRNEGLVAFQCSVTPNWDALLEPERATNPAGVDAAIKILNQLHFTASLAADGSVKVAHNDLPGQSQAAMDALRQIYGGMEQMTSGFYDVWKLFVLYNPFPELASDYQLEASGPQYRLSYKEGLGDVVTLMGGDFAISSLRFTSAEFASSIQPSFTKMSKGFLLNAFGATYQSKKAEEATQLEALIGYQEVDGLQMVEKLRLTGTYGGSPFDVQLTFSDCQVTKKPAGK